MKIIVSDRISVFLKGFKKTISPYTDLDEYEVVVDFSDQTVTFKQLTAITTLKLNLSVTRKSNLQTTIQHVDTLVDTIIDHLKGKGWNLISDTYDEEIKGREINVSFVVEPLKTPLRPTIQFPTEKELSSTLVEWMSNIDPQDQPTYVSLTVEPETIKQSFSIKELVIQLPSLKWKEEYTKLPPPDWKNFILTHIFLSPTFKSNKTLQEITEKLINSPELFHFHILPPKIPKGGAKTT